jgi:uncharacterized membrane protein
MPRVGGGSAFFVRPLSTFMTIPTPLLLLSGVAILVAAIVVALHFLNRHRWDTETGRLRAKGLPWIVLLILTFPFAVLIGSLAGAQFGRGSGVVGLLTILLMARYSRRVSGAKKLE